MATNARSEYEWVAEHIKSKAGQEECLRAVREDDYALLESKYPDFLKWYRSPPEPLPTQGEGVAELD